MLAWAANEGRLPEHGYDGTIKSLARRFQTDEEGFSYFGLKWNSQAHLDKSLKIVVATVGDRQVGKLLGPDFKRWHKNWSAPDGKGQDAPLAREALHGRRALDHRLRRDVWL